MQAVGYCLTVQAVSYCLLCTVLSAAGPLDLSHLSSLCMFMETLFPQALMCCTALERAVHARIIIKKKRKKKREVLKLFSWQPSAISQSATDPISLLFGPWPFRPQTIGLLALRPRHCGCRFGSSYVSPPHFYSFLDHSATATVQSANRSTLFGYPIREPQVPLYYGS